MPVPVVRISGVVESGYGRDLVEQLPQLTRAEYLALQTPGRVWAGEPPLAGEVRFLEWSRAGGLRHAVLASVSDGSATVRQSARGAVRAPDAPSDRVQRRAPQPSELSGHTTRSP